MKILIRKFRNTMADSNAIYIQQWHPSKKDPNTNIYKNIVKVANPVAFFSTLLNRKHRPHYY